jgi:hypothetical protein
MHEFQISYKTVYMHFKLHDGAMCLPVMKFGLLNHSIFNNLNAHFLTAAIALFVSGTEQTNNHIPYKINFKQISTNSHNQN